MDILTDYVFKPVLKRVAGPVAAIFVLFFALPWLAQQVGSENILADVGEGYRFFWSWQIVSVGFSFYLFFGFLKDISLPFSSFARSLINLGLGIYHVALFFWSLSYPFLPSTFREQALVKVSVELATLLLMLAFFLINVWSYRITLNVEGDSPAKEKLQRVIAFVDLPCVLPFIIVIGLGLMTGTYGAFMLGASAILLFVSCILSTLVLSHEKIFVSL